MSESKSTKYTIGAMSKSKSANSNPPAPPAPNTTSGDDFPPLAPSAKKLDMTPRKPMTQMPLAGYGKPDPRAQAAKLKKDALASDATGLPRCADPRCPIKGFHFAKTYTYKSRDLPNAVESLMSKACWASERGVNKALEQSSKRLELFFSVHSKSNLEANRSYGSPARSVDEKRQAPLESTHFQSPYEAHRAYGNPGKYYESYQAPYGESDDESFEEST